MNISRLNKLSELVTMATKRKPKVMLESKKISRIIANKNSKNIDINIDIDVEAWTITDEMRTFIENLNSDTNLSVEEKILKIYEKVCTDYIYDDNVLSYIRKYDDDQFGLPDFYGRDTDEKWKQNRSKHNRRNCFELSRLLVKSIATMLKTSGIEDLYEICILWDEPLAHYFGGLISDDYCLTLDVDDFEEIKDLTRLKTGLTIKGIRILEDPDKKFQTVLDKFNSERWDSSIEHIEDIKRGKNADNSTEEINSINTDDIQFLRYAIEILTEDYKLDSPGLFEYMREIVDIKIGPGSRRKIWVEVETSPKEATRHTRCLTVEIGSQLYIIDVTCKGVEQIFRPISQEEISTDPNSGHYTKYQCKSWEDPYDGR